MSIRWASAKIKYVLRAYNEWAFSFCCRYNGNGKFCVFWCVMRCRTEIIGKFTIEIRLRLVCYVRFAPVLSYEYYDIVHTFKILFSGCSWQTQKP